MNEILRKEVTAFVEKGLEYGFVEPQSMAEGAYRGKFIDVDGVRSIDLTRLDYLSLGQNSTIKEIMDECINSFDTACPCSQMAMKTSSTIKLEKAVADLHGMEDAVLFLSGYATNLNIIQALALRLCTSHMTPYVRATGIETATRKIPTEFFVDGETHYSLVHGIKSARAIAPGKVILNRYPTTNYDRLEKLLIRSVNNSGNQAIRIIVTDTISSVSGKIFDIQRLCRLAEKYDCMLYVDEAHAIGSVGPGGCGITSQLADFERYKSRIIIMGTLTKGVAQLGGYVAVSDKSLASFFRAASPEYIFSAPLPPWMAEAIVRVMDLLRGDYGEQERKKLHDVSLYMRTKLVERGFDIMGSETQIIPILGGEEEVSIQTKEYLQSKGFTTALFECPAVPKGASIVRFSLCSDITIEEVDQVVSHLLEAREMFGL